MRRSTRVLSSLIAASSLAILIVLAAAGSTAYADIVSGGDGGDDTALGRNCGKVTSDVLTPGQPPVLGCRSTPQQACRAKRVCNFDTNPPAVNDTCSCQKPQVAPL